uniref:Glycosyltransferase n=1 Tax=viral metagenome TaxID=1070528 RepID=A0A6C0DIW9_9ZZZZ
MGSYIGQHLEIYFKRSKLFTTIFIQMFATNPKNGKQIRIMNSDASAWKDSKTLAWMKEPFSKDKKRWNRWDLLVTSVEPGFLKWKPDILLLTEETPEANAFLKTMDAKDIRFILVSTKALKSLNSEAFDISSLGNVICLEEFQHMYPFLGPAWSGTVEDAILCASIIFRYNRVIGLNPTHDRLNQLRFNDLKLEILERHGGPEPLVLIQQLYKSPNKTRNKELQKCLRKNLENPYIDEILLFIEGKDVEVPVDKKIKQVPMKSRLSYANCIDAIQKVVGPGKLVVFANADIYLEKSWKAIWSVNMKDIFFALLRWEEVDGKEPTLFGPRNDSQDTWAIHSDSVLNKTWNLDAFNIPFGKAGCDNAILVEFLRNKFKIINPAMSLKTIHVHASEIRNYEKTDIIDRPIYMFVKPSGLHELHPITSWSGWAGEPIPYEALDRPLKATTAKHLNMFCSQINRDPSFVWAAEGLNSYMPPVGQDRPIEVVGGAFVSPSGLVYRHTDIYVGETDIQKSVWSDNRLSHLMASYNVESMMAFQLDPTWVQEPALFTLYYLSKVIQQNKKNPNSSFWCKKTNYLLAAIQLFKWEKAQGRLLEYSEQGQVFAQHVVGRTCHGTRPVKVDIDALRDAMNGKWQSTVSLLQKKAIIVEDTYHMKDDLVNKLSEKLKNAGYQVEHILTHSDATKWAIALSGASLVLLSSSLKNIKDPSWAWLWLAPIGCRILELQEEREPSDLLVHLAAASGLDWTLLQYPRSTPEGFKKIVEKEVDKFLVVSGKPAPKLELNATLSDTIPCLIETEALTAKPVIRTPPKSMKFGFFGHKGDSFREMIDLWVERDFVERKEDSSLTHCFLGDVLLYDRPTWNWLDKASDKEKGYRLCLTGNPDSSEKPRAKPWIFWPREPRLVEELSQIPRKSYEDRKDTMVFYGRIENQDQGKWRQDISGWKMACAKFSMQQGKEPYVLKPREYLETLQNAKYGLCIRGYGPKCNREIELLAMGTVPVVTNGVEISDYAEPLVDGTHVLCVSDYQDAMEKICKISEEKWLEMSEAGFKWWKRNCSVEGSWNTTRNLLN